MRNCSRDSGKYHANSPPGLDLISSTLLLRRSVTTVMFGVSPAKTGKVARKAVRSVVVREEVSADRWSGGQGGNRGESGRGGGSGRT